MTDNEKRPLTEEQLNEPGRLVQGRPRTNDPTRLFLTGVRHGLMKISLWLPMRVEDPLPPMPTPREWLESYGGANMDGETFDRCEAEWYALVERRRRLTNIYLAGTCAYALATLAMFALVAYLIWRLVPCVLR
ncbi:MAG: hypothetical protein E7H36_10560 [Bifidobacterium dentium]|nr:hypothetical protein [Bifidobacterium dentium]